MNRRWLSGLVVVALMFVWIGSDIASAQTYPVTFKVKMSIKMREGTFLPGSGDIVRVAGGFNGWGGSTDTLRDVTPVDSVYEKTINLAAGDIAYKFLKTLRGGLDWEADPNRAYTVIAGTNVLPVVWFDRDSVFTPPVNANVAFQVRMNIQMIEQKFRPDLGDSVAIRGSFNGWGPPVRAALSSTDSIARVTLSVLEGSSISYKFWKSPARGGVDWEGDPNRAYDVPTGGGTVPPVYFNRDSIPNPPVSANINWQVDLRAFLDMGWFVPTSRDTMEVRGSFNGWGGSPRQILQPLPGSPTVYFITNAYDGNVGDALSYKFYMDLDSAGAIGRFPGFNADQDGHRYDHPYERGDGNRIFAIPGGGNLTPDRKFYSDINPRGVLRNTTDSVTITLKVNMGPARRPPSTFNPATDTVKLVLQDPIYVSAQRRINPAFGNVILATRQIPGNDTLYQASYKVKGKAHYGIMYAWRYTKAAGAGEETEGAGLGTQGGYRVRWITPTGSNTFPPTYTSSANDIWQLTTPLPADPQPFPSAIGDGIVFGVPDQYRLYQNYPNPFNPSTRIFYSIPEQSKVTLKVFNLLGQEVATLVNDQQVKGNHVAVFGGNGLASGIYFYRLEAGKFSETRKMILMK